MAGELIRTTPVFLEGAVRIKSLWKGVRRGPMSTIGRGWPWAMNSTIRIEILGGFRHGSGAHSLPRRVISVCNTRIASMPCKPKHS